MLQETELSFRTDFNSVRDDGSITALYGFGGSADVPRANDIVCLFDGDGNSCRAVVLRADSDLVYAWPDWRTWRAGVRIESDLAETLAARVRSFSLGPRTAGEREPEVFQLEPV